MSGIINKAIRTILISTAVVSVCFFGVAVEDDAKATVSELSNPSLEYITRDIVQFGNFWQEDTNGDGKCNTDDEKQPIEWQVLYEDKDGNALLLADKIIDYVSFNTGTGMSTWKTSGIRTRLNEGFLNEAFSSSEQNSIITSRIKGDYGSGYAETEDKLFLLSVDEAWDDDYRFGKDTPGASEARIGKMTGYAEQKGHLTLDIEKTHSWFLRTNGTDSKGENDYYISIVNEYGGGSMTRTYSGGGIRPAMRVNLNSAGLARIEKRNIAINRTIWNSVKLGKYAGVDLVWRVLSVDGNTALLLADRCIEKRPFHTGSKVMSWAGCTWKDSDIRSWLNDDNDGFYESAFDQNEKSSIKSVTIKNPDNREYGVSGGEETTDRVFLLSAEDVVKMAYGFSSLSNCFGLARETYDFEGNRVSDGWWLRTSGSSTSNAVTIENGMVNLAGDETTNGNVGIRPAMYIDLSAGGWEKGGDITSDDSPIDLIPDPNAKEDPTPEEPQNLEYTKMMKKYKSKIKKMVKGEIIISRIAFHDFDKDKLPECIVEMKNKYYNDEKVIYSLSWNGSKVIKKKLGVKFVRINGKYIMVRTYVSKEKDKAKVYLFNKKTKKFDKVVSSLVNHYRYKYGLSSFLYADYYIGKKHVTEKKYNKWERKKKIASEYATNIEWFSVSSVKALDEILK